MLEITAVQACVIACMSEAAALDKLSISGCVAFRVAPDEVLLFSQRQRAEDILLLAASALGASSLCVDQSDAWTGFMLGGSDRDEAFSRLSFLSPNSAAQLQGTVASVPAKVIVGADSIYLFVPSPVADHVRARVTTLTQIETRVLEASPFVPHDSGGAPAHATSSVHA